MRCGLLTFSAEVILQQISTNREQRRPWSEAEVKGSQETECSWNCNSGWSTEGRCGGDRGRRARAGESHAQERRRLLNSLHDGRRQEWGQKWQRCEPKAVEKRQVSSECRISTGEIPRWPAAVNQTFIQQCLPHSHLLQARCQL